MNNEPSITETSIQLGAASVVYKSTCYKNADQVLFINLHQNENTSVKAAALLLDSLKRYCMVELNSGNNRNLFFTLRRQPYQVDPNRIFSPEGIKASLERLNKKTVPKLAKRVEAHAAKLKRKLIDDSKFIIALHNNTDSNLSILSFVDGGNEAETAARVFVNEDHDPDDFFYTTSDSIFEALAARNFNVVLEKENAPDDGSLSVYCNKNSIPYINVEAEHGHLEQQLEMLRVVHDILQVPELLKPRFGHPAPN